MTGRNRRSGARLSYPPVLDACCGSRMFWFDKADERALFYDRRNESLEIAPDRAYPNGTTIRIEPDVVGDFTDMPFPDNTFGLVVFDPPHLTRLGDNSTLAKKYGKLFGDWESDLREGFAECFRVLRPGGVLVFKWCSTEIPLARVLTLTQEKPLFGHTTGIRAATHWVCWMKPCSVSVPVAECG